MLHKGCNKMRGSCCAQTTAYICYYRCVSVIEKWKKVNIIKKKVKPPPLFCVTGRRCKSKRNKPSSVLEKRKNTFLFFLNAHICTIVPKCIAASTKETKTGNGAADFAVWVLQSHECGRHLGHCRPCENRSALSLIEYVSPISLAGWAWLVLPAQKVL